MLREPHAQIQIACHTAARTVLAASGNPQSLAFGDARGNFDLMGFGARTVPHADGTDRAARSFFERDHDVAFHVASALGEFFLGKIGGTAKAARATAHPRSKKLLKEITKARAAKMGLKIFTTGIAPAKSLVAGEMFPAGWRTKVRAGLPIRAEFVVFFALGRVTQDLVGLVDFLEFFLSLLFVPGDVGMILPREFAEGFFQLLRSEERRVGKECRSR